MKNLVVLSGAGISEESGVNTFRDSGGLWEGHDVKQVATPEGWNKNRELVLDFYNKRRHQLLQVKPNTAHLALADLEKFFKINIITQNVDNLHERAGSTNVTHLHGELLKVRSTKNDNYIIDWKKDLKIGDTDNEGNQLRPHVVWFGEAVPMMEKAMEMVSIADILLIVGTSMQVYPAAGLIDFISEETPVFFVDPKPVVHPKKNLHIFAENASIGVPEVVKILKTDFLS